jgi:hypothetical protein
LLLHLMLLLPLCIGRIYSLPDAHGTTVSVRVQNHREGLHRLGQVIYFVGFVRIVKFINFMVSIGSLVECQRPHRR